MGDFCQHLYCEKVYKYCLNDISLYVRITKKESAMELTKNLLLSEDMSFAVEKYTYNLSVNMKAAHYHDHYEMLYVLENERRITVNNQAYTLKADTIALIPPYTPHRTIAGGKTPETRILVNFKESYVHWLVDKLNIDLLSCFDPASSVIELGAHATDVRNTLIRLCSVYESRELYSESRAMLILGDVLMTLSSITGERPYSRSFFDVIKYIETHYSEKITLDDLSQRFFMSKYTFLRKFKMHTGMGLPAYVNEIRLINAKNMLASGAKITEAAIACGFESLSNFDRVFRKETGISPREYVRQSVGK